MVMEQTVLSRREQVLVLEAFFFVCVCVEELLFSVQTYGDFVALFLGGYEWYGVVACCCLMCWYVAF